MDKLWFPNRALRARSFSSSRPNAFMECCGMFMYKLQEKLWCVIPSLYRLSEPCAWICHSYIWTTQVSGLLQYQQCTYYDDCAITSVFLFCKSENLERQSCNKVYIFLLHFLEYFSFLWALHFHPVWKYASMFDCNGQSGYLPPKDW